MEVIAEIADSIVDETNILASGSRYAPLDGTCMFEDPLARKLMYIGKNEVVADHNPALAGSNHERLVPASTHWSLMN